MANIKIIDELKKNYGENSIVKARQLPDWVCVPLGIPELDMQLGGGIHVGHFNCFVGAKNVGKTSLSYQTIKQFQKIGASCYYFDFDRFFDADRAKSFGVDTNELTTISEGLYTELAEKIGISIMKSHAAEKKDKQALIVVDSVAAMASMKTMETEAGEGYGTGDAKANNRLFKIWNGIASRNITFLVIQQYRQGIGFGESDIMPGGEGQGYVYSNILELRAGKTIKEGDLPVGQEFKWTVKKTKNTSPKQTGDTVLNYMEGFNEIDKSLVYTAIDLGIIKGEGAWFTVGESRLNGKVKVFEYLRSNPDAMEKLWTDVYAQMPTAAWDGQPIEIKPENAEL